MFQEPCCVERKLPSLLKEHPYFFFQTSGDVLVPKFMSAVSYLAGGHMIFFLAIPKVDAYFLREVNYYFSREWYHGLILLTAEDQTELVRNEMKDRLPQVEYAFHASLRDGCFALFGEEKAVVLQGPMLLGRDPHLCLYTGYLGQNKDTLRAVMEGFFPKVHLKSTIQATDESLSRLLQYQFNF